MTDTRLPDKWLLNPSLDKLSDSAWRVFTRALMFCNQQGTDGHIDALYMRHIYPWGSFDTYVEELLSLGWFVRSEAGFQIPDWEAIGQSTAADVEAYRAKNRAKSKRSRDKQKALSSPPVTGDVTSHVGQERPGKDTQGQANYEEASWPEVRKPGGG